MTILNAAAIEKFAGKHRDAAKPLANWLQVAAGANWRNILEICEMYPAVDGVVLAKSGGVATVFNIRGNTYRLIVIIDFERAVIRIAQILTHAEYDKDMWKDRL